MQASELRELADVIEPMGQAPRFSCVNVPAACAYLRACADALDAGPVAWHDPVRHVMMPDCVFTAWSEAYQEDTAPFSPLYPIAMPGALRLPEPMTDKAIVLAGAPWHWNLATGQTLADLKDFARAIEAETLRRVKEANE